MRTRYYYGSQAGGRKAMQTNREKYDKLYEAEGGFAAHIGRLGGTKSRGGGFADNIVGADGLTGHERSVIAGRKGGSASRRGKDTKPRAAREIPVTVKPHPWRPPMHEVAESVPEPVPTPSKSWASRVAARLDYLRGRHDA